MPFPAQRFTAVSCTSMALLLSWPSEILACEPPPPDAVLPEPERISDGEAAAGFIATGVVSGAASVALATVLDQTGRFPTVAATLTSLVVPASAVPLTWRACSGAVPDPGMSVKEFSLRALVPLTLGMLPSAVFWWTAGSSTTPSVGATIHIGPEQASATVLAHF